MHAAARQGFARPATLRSILGQLSARAGLPFTTPGCVRGQKAAAAQRASVQNALPRGHRSAEVVRRPQQASSGRGRGGKAAPRAQSAQQQAPVKAAPVPPPAQAAPAKAAKQQASSTRRRQAPAASRPAARDKEAKDKPGDPRLQGGPGAQADGQAQRPPGHRQVGVYVFLRGHNNKTLSFSRQGVPCGGVASELVPLYLLCR